MVSRLKVFLEGSARPFVRRRNEDLERLVDRAFVALKDVAGNVGAVRPPPPFAHQHSPARSGRRDESVNEVSARPRLLAIKRQVAQGFQRGANIRGIRRFQRCAKALHMHGGSGVAHALKHAQGPANHLRITIFEKIFGEGARATPQRAVVVGMLFHQPLKQGHRQGSPALLLDNVGRIEDVAHQRQSGRSIHAGTEPAKKSAVNPRAEKPQACQGNLPGLLATGAERGQNLILMDGVRVIETSDRTGNIAARIGHDEGSGGDEKSWREAGNLQYLCGHRGLSTFLTRSGPMLASQLSACQHSTYQTPNSCDEDPGRKGRQEAFLSKHTLQHRAHRTGHRARAVAAYLFGPTLFLGACAQQQPVEDALTRAELVEVQERVEDVERTNGRLTVRIEEMERQLVLMQDRVEANRIVLQRRGYLRNSHEAFAQAEPSRPAPAPESHYSQRAPQPESYYDGYSASPQPPVERRPVTHIPLSDQQSGRQQAPVQEHIEIVVEESDASDDETVVFTNEDLAAYFGQEQQTQPAPKSNTSGGSRRAQAPVTDERLATREEVAQAAPAPASSAPPQSQRELLELYQEALTSYRAGSYGEALEGFETFLRGKPREDYIDNALYWIGECHYGLGNFSQAVSQFERILTELPGAAKVPDAMLKMSLAYDRLGQPGRAVDLLRKLSEEYPTTNAGKLGIKRLEEHPHRDAT
ncbi:tetratricopeptide repeat protein [Lujinxingia sediminis]|uniref:Tetratricopeptide repeat protein n=1 Tax=Lujinxingia sediminis TaxID=2480984 RepID=A0ABY0CY19_9DELT|nr:tetratricopeptide repeat protein [Lujinxingia sediminis]